MIGRLISGLLAAALSFGGVAHAQSTSSLSPEAAPPGWVTYAEAVNAAVIRWLGEDSERSQRAMLWLGERQTVSDGASSTVILRLWIDPNGVVEHVVLDPSANPAAEAELRSALVGRHLDQRPPLGILMPLRLAVELSTDVPTAL